MSWIQTRRRAQEAPAGRPMEDTLRRQMAWAAGTEQFQHRDPLYHVTESFQQTFDAIGRRHARQLAGGRTEEGAEERADQTSGENQMPDQTSARSFYERSRPEDQDMVRRFSETAFQRGPLSGAVLEGTGQMMADSLGRYYAMETGYKAKADQMREMFRVQREEARAAYAQNPKDNAIEDREKMFERVEMERTEIAKVDALGKDSERQRKINARTAQFFARKNTNSGGATTRDLIQFLGNGTDADFDVSDARLDEIYQASVGSKDEKDLEKKKENGRKLLQPFKDSVSVLRDQMAQLGNRHNTKPISQNDVIVRYQETAELYKKAQVTRDMGIQMYRAGAIQEGDPGYEEFLDNLYYVGGVCAYVMNLKSDGGNVEKGNMPLGEVITFEEGLEKGKTYVRTVLKL